MTILWTGRENSESLIGIIKKKHIDGSLIGPLKLRYKYFISRLFFCLSASRSEHLCSSRSPALLVVDYLDQVFSRFECGTRESANQQLSSTAPQFPSLFPLFSQTNKISSVFNWRKFASGNSTAETLIFWWQNFAKSSNICKTLTFLLTDTRSHASSRFLRLSSFVKLQIWIISVQTRACCNLGWFHVQLIILHVKL